MDNETSQAIDSLAQEFIELRREGDPTGKIPSTNESIERHIAESPDPNQTAADVLKKILSLARPSEILITIEAARVAAKAVVKTLTSHHTSRSTTIEFDPKTGKPVVLPGFNPRKKFG